MKTLKTFVAIACIFFVSTQDISAQKKSKKKDKDFFSQEVIPYGVGGMDVPLSFSRTNQTAWGAYSETVYDPIFTMGHEVYTYNLAHNIKSSIGTGIDMHLPLVYLLACNDESRFRVADDMGVGFTFGSLSSKRKDYFTHDKIPNSKEINAHVGGSLSFWAGLQAYYRINKMVDVGLKYYPWYVYFGLGPDGVAAGKCTGLHARVANVYLDFQWVSGWKKNNKPSTMPKTYIVKAKFLYNEEKRQFLFLNFMYNHRTDPNDLLGVSNIPKEITDIKTVPTNWGVYQLGWGIMF